MSVNLKSEGLSLKEIICSKYGQTKVESDLIVPDLKPDIGKILQVCAKGVITQKTAQQDKAYIQGVVPITVVYISEDGEIKSILTDLDFSHIIDAKGAEAGNHIWAETEIEGVDYSIVNSRKISLKIDLGIDMKIGRSLDLKLPTALGDCPHIQAKYGDCRINCASLEEEQDFRFKETLEIPSGKADIGEIIKLSGRIIPSDLRYENGTINVSGDVLISALYTAPDKTLCTIEEALPFSETLEGMTLPKGECDAHFSVKETKFEAVATEDSPCRFIDIDLLICGSFKSVNDLSLSIIDDAFGTKEPLKLIKATYEIENISDKTTTQIAHKESVAVPDYLPEVYKICDLSGEARVTGISIDEGRINIDGEILSNIIYMSSSDENPHSGFCHISAFSQTLDMPSALGSSICEAKVTLDHAGYSISSERSLELRFIIILSVTLLNGHKLSIIEEIQVDEDCPKRKLPSALIYFPEEGETLWSIAKRYMATPEDIMKNNAISEETLHKGQKICIFR